MRNFGSGLVYTINDSTPVYARACSFNDFTSHMGSLGLQEGIRGGLGGLAVGGITGGPAGMLPGAALGFTGGFVGGAGWGFIEKARECFF
ncbi:hypothetical protein [Bartonella harrusi]|uniref:Uncharacterized protein n=1 Tax=Bartonella harrusi TaxID=2961895 RepID=A0ABY5EWK0_9HYPH|nr:hypothetical protein [Bartonella harrusi]UTO28283.1 hypothetical protein NMK50_09125 [Bartonella harrusi]